MVEEYYLYKSGNEILCYTVLFTLFDKYENPIIF